MLGLTWLKGLLRRRTARMVGQTAGVAIAVLLLGALGTFFAASRGSMSTRAVRAVPVDWQVQLSARAPVGHAVAAVAATSGVTAALPVGYAATSGLSSHDAGAVQTTGPGVVLGLPPGYASIFPGEIPPLGRRQPRHPAGAADSRQPRRDTRFHDHDRPSRAVARRPGRRRRLDSRPRIPCSNRSASRRGLGSDRAAR